MKPFKFKNINKYTVIDACSTVNLISSKMFLSHALNDGFEFNMTRNVEFELVSKPLRRPNKRIEEQREYIKHLLAQKDLIRTSLSIDDLHELAELEERKKLGIGELSCIAYAKHKRLTVITDDTDAGNFAEKVLGNDYANNTADLLGNLLYRRIIIDNEYDSLIQEHLNNKGNMKSLYDAVRSIAIREMYSSN